MLVLQIESILLRINQCGLGICMPHQCLYLVQGNSTMDTTGSERMPQFMRINVHFSAFCDLGDYIFNPLDAEPSIGPTIRYNECFTIICPGLKVFPESQFGFGIEEDYSPLVTLAVTDDH